MLILFINMPCMPCKISIFHVWRPATAARHVPVLVWGQGSSVHLPPGFVTVAIVQLAPALGLLGGDDLAQSAVSDPLADGAAFGTTNPGLSWTFTQKQRQLFYPEWMEGTWQVIPRLHGHPQLVSHYLHS